MLRVGVIGVGMMGKNHARIYSEFPDVELIGVADVNPGLAEEASLKYHVPAYSDYRELLERRPDAVSIVVPTSLHEKVAGDVARAKVHMLIEKPLADSVPAGKKIIFGCEENRVKLMVGHVERFNPVISVLKKEIMGEQISLIETTRIGPFPPRIRDVGVLIDLATHDIDLIRYITGAEIINVYGLTSRNVAEHEDVAILVFEMDNGSLARLTTNWLTPYKVRELTVATRQRFLKAALIEQKVTEYSRYKENESYVVREIRVPFGEPLKIELRAFLDCIKSDTQPPVTGYDGIKVLDILSQYSKEIWQHHEPKSLSDSKQLLGSNI